MSVRSSGPNSRRATTAGEYESAAVSTVHRTVEAVWRLEAARIIGGLTHMIGDIGLAEEFAQDAVVAALEQWPRSGVPPNPGAWLTLTAKRRAFDRARRVERLQHRPRSSPSSNNNDGRTRRTPSRTTSPTTYCD